jgi:hypothetical protein
MRGTFFDFEIKEGDVGRREIELRNAAWAVYYSSPNDQVLRSRTCSSHLSCSAPSPATSTRTQRFSNDVCAHKAILFAPRRQTDFIGNETKSFTGISGDTDASD